MRHLLFLLLAMLITIRATAALQVNVEPTTLVTNESGSSVTYRVVLDQAPSAGEVVTVSPSSGDVTEGTVSADVTFTDADWSEPKTVTVTPGATGDGNDGDVAFTITNTTSAIGGTASFDVAPTPNVSVINRNKDGVSSVFMDPPSGGAFYLDEGTSQTVTVSVSGAPANDISVDVSAAGSEVTLSTGTVTLTAGNGYSATFDVTAADDAVNDGDQAFTIVTAPAVSGDAAYNGINIPDIEGQALDTDPVPGLPPALVPVGLNPGDEFYVIFVGSDTVNGAQTSAVYNAYAATVKAKDPDTDAIDGWQTLFSHDDGTLTTLSAFGTETSQPIYNTNGDKVADNQTDFYDGTLDAAIEYDESGAATARGVWTGFSTSGGSVGRGDDTLGGVDSLADGCLAGYSSEASSRWTVNSLSGGNGCASANFSLYVLSPLLRVPGFTVSGSLTGLAGGSSVVLQLNGTDDQTLSADGGFSFAPLAEGAAYDVTVASQPDGQTCTVTSGSGTSSGGDVTDVAVACSSLDTATAAVPGGGSTMLRISSETAGCAISSFSIVQPDSLTPAPPAGLEFPFGVADFVVSGCDSAGATLRVEIDYGAAVPAGATLWKSDPWRQISGAISGNTASYTLTDGGSGDVDGVANGTIVDPVGVAVGSAGMGSVRTVPAMPLWALALLSLVLAGVGGRRFIKV